MTAITNSSNETTRVSFFRSIQGQLIVWFLALGLIPLIVVGVVSYVSANNALRDSIQNGLEGVVQIKAVRVEDWITDTIRMVQSVSEMPSIAGSVHDSAIGLEALERHLNNPDSEAFLVAHDTAFVTMEAFRDIYDRIDDVILLSPEGITLASTWTDYLNTGDDIHSISTVEFDSELEGVYISDVILSVDGVTPVLGVMYAVHDYSGEKIGVVMLRVNMRAISSVMQDTTGLGQTGETYLVDLDQKLMISQARLITENTILQQSVDTYAVNQALAGVYNGSDDYSAYRGESVVGAWQTVENEYANWLVLAEQNSSEAYKPTYDLSAIVVVIALAAAVLITVVAYWIARTISRPVTRVSEVAVRIADGALDERAAVHSRNEVGILASAFNRMTNNLQSMMEAERDGRTYLERTVSDYMSFVERVAQGDLTERLQVDGSRVEGFGELVLLGQNLNSMVGSLGEMASQIRETASSLSAAAAEIQAATTQQMASATEQDAAVTQTATTVEEVRTTVVQTAERAQMVADTARQSVEVSRSGQTSVADTVDGMQMIRQRVEDIAANILMLSERTQQIGEIIATVNEIADQSKLLALNASIEAARAGEEGKGFAVVANEVRQLAEQSREATARVSEILGEIQQATNTAVMVTEEGSKGAEAGMDLVERAGDSIRELSVTIESAAQAAAQIAASTHQQTNGMDQLGSAMTSIKQASTQAAASTRQAERSAQDMLEMARQMEALAARYRL
jgi:methyl-accepting chemotaxis protein